MELKNTNDIVFVFIGTRDYHFMINKNIELLRRLYPYSPVIVYDWGAENGKASGTAFSDADDVIDWHSNILDTWDLMDVYNEDRLVEIGKAFNSRLESGISRRLTKFFLKRFPNSAKARRAIERGLRYENLLIHKSYNLMDCSRRLAGKQFLLMDADAYLVERIDEIFEGSPDIVLPMLKPSLQSWGYNNCHALSTGVMGFGLDTDYRNAFLDEWSEIVAVNDEWFRELAALNRMVKAKAPKVFSDWGTTSLQCKEFQIRLRTVDNDIINCAYNYENVPENISRAKVLHLAGIAQRPNLFVKYIQIVEAEIERRIRCS